MKKHNKYPSDVLVCELLGAKHGVVLMGTISTIESAADRGEVILFSVVIETATRDVARSLASAARLWTIVDLVKACNGVTDYGEHIVYLKSALPYVGYNNAALLNASQAMVVKYYRERGVAVNTSLLAFDARNVYPSYVIPLNDNDDGIDRSAFVSSYSMFAKHAFAGGLFKAMLFGDKPQVHNHNLNNKDD